MADPPIKDNLESLLFTQNGEPTQTLLNNCLAADAGHIRPGTKNGAVAIIQAALNQIKRAADPTTIADITDTPGDFGRDTVKEVHAFKASRGIQRTGFPLDDIVGRGTITALDNEVAALEGVQPKPPVVTRFLDIVIQIKGFGGPNSKAQGQEQPSGSLRDRCVSAFYNTTRTNRTCTTIVFTGGQDPDPTDQIVRQVREAISTSGRVTGIVCLFGGSAGGKNVLRLAAELQPVIFPATLAYVGVSDGAFFDADAVDPPNDNGDNLKIALKTPFTARLKNNIFQSAGNGTALGVLAFRKIWQGKMPNHEVHGPIAGFDFNRDLTAEGLVVSVGDTTDFELLHTNAVDQGDAEHERRIKRLLDS